MPLNTQPPVGLEDILGWGGITSSQLYNQSRQNNKINQDQELQGMLFKAQEQPFKLDQLGLNNDTTRAQLPGVKADSWQKQRNQQVREGVPLDQEQRAKISEIAAKMSDDDWKQQENALNQALIDPSADVRAHAQKLLPMLKEFQMEAMKNKDRMDRENQLEELKQAGRTALADKKLAAIQAQKNQDAPLKMSPQQAIIYYRDKKGKAKSAEEYEKFQVLEEEAMKDAYALQQMRPTAPGTVDPAATTGLPAVQPVAPRETRTLPGSPEGVKPATQAPAPIQDYTKWKIDDWKKRYPNSSEAQIRSAAKAKGIIINE